MKLIVGLGNPGLEYANTRHNVGFMAIDDYVKKNKIPTKKHKFNGEYFETNINGEKIVLLKPLKYMNLSGEVVKAYCDFYKISIDNILVIHDDLDLPCGKIRLKQSTSSGGHNGLKDIDKNLKTKEYRRLKIGISKHLEISTKDYVLGKFNKEELVDIKSAIEKASEIINEFTIDSFNNMMSKYN